MRKLILFNMVSLDGFFEGPNRDIDWHTVDEEFNEFAIEQLNQVDTLVFGRVTYELMASYWPTPAALADDPIIAEMMNHTPKIVFSKTLENIEWENTRLVKGDIEKEIATLKEQLGKDLIIFGSAKLAAACSKLGQIDEYRIMVSPIILGKGEPLFKSTHQKQNLKLSMEKTFRNGNVLLCYQVVESEK